MKQLIVIALVVIAGCGAGYTAPEDAGYVPEWSCRTDAECSDGLFCNGIERCIQGACVATTPPCGSGTCNETYDTCGAPTIQPEPESEPECLTDGDCADGVFCTGVETCIAGSCQAGGYPCPGQMCDEVNDVCAECLDDGDCDDGVFCNGLEACEDGLCLAGNPPCPGMSCNEAGRVCVAATPPPTPEPEVEPEPSDPETTFVAGNLFSFLTPEETEFFWLRVATGNAEIDRLVEAELSAELADLTSRGFSRYSSLAANAMCRAERTAIQLKREYTWILLEEIAVIFGFSLYPLSLEQVLEVDAFNCQAYRNETFDIYIEGSSIVISCVIDLPCS